MFRKGEEVQAEANTDGFDESAMQTSEVRFMADKVVSVLLET